MHDQLMIASLHRTARLSFASPTIAVFQNQLLTAAPMQSYSAESMRMPTASALTDFWNLPHPGLAPDWVTPSDKPMQATTQTSDHDTMSDHASTTPAAAPTSADRVSAETASDVATDTLDAHATDTDVVVTVIEDKPVTGSVSQADVATKSSGNEEVLVQIEEAPGKSAEWIPVQQVADIISKGSRKPATSKDSSDVGVLVQIVEESEHSTEWIPVQHAAEAISKDSKKAAETANRESPAMNWLIEQKSASVQSTDGDNTDADGDDNNTAIEVHVYEGLL